MDLSSLKCFDLYFSRNIEGNQGIIIMQEMSQRRLELGMFFFSFKNVSSLLTARLDDVHNFTCFILHCSLPSFGYFNTVRKHYLRDLFMCVYCFISVKS